MLHIINASQRTKQQKIHLDNRSLYLIMVPARCRVEWVTSTPKVCTAPHTHSSASPPHPPVARRKLELQHWDTGDAELWAECWQWHPADKEAEQCSIRSAQDYSTGDQT